MVAFPKPQSQIPGLIYAAREAEAGPSYDGLGFSPSDLGSECDRYLWYKLHWAHPAETFGGRMLRLFETGHIQEARLIEDLKRTGIDVYEVDPDTGKQFLARALGGHVRGKLDGIATAGVPEAPKKSHVVECKSHGTKSWKALLKAGTVREGKFEHWVQCQLYMHIRGIDRALYVAVYKDTDEIYCERIEYDHDFCTKLLVRLERILDTAEPPARLCNKRDDFRGKFCKAAAVCWGEAFGRLNCRTCLHASPDMSGDAAWTCARWAKPINMHEQKEACPAHLYVPALVPGECVDSDPERELVFYRLHDGREWVDGRDEAEVPAAIENQGEEA